MENPSRKDETLRSLLRFPAENQIFLGRRRGNQQGEKVYVVDYRGAGTDLNRRQEIVAYLAEEARHFRPFDIIVGVATGGMIWSAWLAWKQDRPYATVLKDRRASGMQRQVEGEIKDKRVILIDNSVSTGDSIRKAADAIKEVGGISVGTLSIVGNRNVNLGMPVRMIWERSYIDRFVSQKFYSRR